jgi:hypothetical protein
MLMNRFIDAVENGWYKPNSPFLIQELGSLERKVSKAGKSRMEHQSGKHDDRVLAAATSTLPVMLSTLWRSVPRYVMPLPRRNLPDLDLPMLSFRSSSRRLVNGAT